VRPHRRAGRASRLSGRPRSAAARAAGARPPALRDLAAGETVELRVGDRTRRLTLPEPIPLCHKLALHALAVGQEVRKYGEVIGRTSAAVEPGGWVHVHNLKSLRAQRARTA
jgi:altronate dehydratase small subunit